MRFEGSRRRCVRDGKRIEADLSRRCMKRALGAEEAAANAVPPAFAPIGDAIFDEFVRV